MRPTWKTATAFAALVTFAAGCSSSQQEDDSDDVAEDATGEEAAEAPAAEAAPEAVAGAPGGGSQSFEDMLAAMKNQAKQAGVAVSDKAPQKAPAQPQAAAPASGGAAAPAAEAMWVFTERAPVYAAPDKASKKLETLPYGDQVAALSAQDDWVRIGDGRYVERKRLTDRKARFGGKVVGQKAAPAGGKPAKGKRTLKAEGLAVRSGPSLDAPVVGYLKTGDDFTVVAEGWNGWSRIGDKRYVRTKYLTGGGPAKVGSGPEAYTVKAEAVYIRRAPALDAPVVGVLKTGDTVHAASPQDGWVQLAPNRFVRAKHLEQVGH